MSDLVWIEHPDLPGQHLKVPADSIGGMYAPAGWRERADQSDPVDEDAAAAIAANERAADDEAPDEDAENEEAPPADEDAATTDTTKKKGR